MKLLLDTHVVLWWQLDDRRLGAAARKLIAHADLVLVSAASAWEIAIKQGLGRIRLEEPFLDLVERHGFEQLDVRFSHAERVALLPPHHNDPFDRLLVAQAQVEGATLVTSDPHLEPYPVTIVWA